jgi:hypothetical protein
MEAIMEIFGTGMFFYFFIVAAIFAIGDFAGIATKAKLSSVFVALLLFLVGFLTGILPGDIIKRAGLTEIGSMSVALLIFHMGTMINIKQLIQEYKTVITAILSMVVVMLACFAASPIIGMENALVIIPVMNGGIIATQIMTDGAMNSGLTFAAGLATILYAIKKFAGAYPASLFGVREAKIILEEYRANKEKFESQKEVSSSEDAPPKCGFADKYDKYFTDYVCLAVTVFFAWIAVGMGKLIPTINYSIWALVLGAMAGYMRWVPARILEKGRISGLISMVIFAIIVPSLAKVTVEQLVTMGFYMMVVFAFSLVTIFVCFYVLPGWKIRGSRNLAVGIALGQFLGFPATFLIANEIAKAVTDDEKEQQAVLSVIMPSYVVAGLATVTTFSIVIAGIFVKFI